MKHRVALILSLVFLFFALLAFSLLAGQNRLLRTNEEMLFRSREELVLAENRIREEEERINALSEEVDVLSHGEKPTVMLTFDDGPSALTGEILDILKAEEVRALFFINGVNVTRKREDLLTRAVEEGHIIGNHTYSHDYNRIYRSPSGFLKDFNRNEELIWEWTGTRSMLVRFPGGSRNSLCATEEGRQLMDDLKNYMDRSGYVYMDWNVTETSEDPRVLLESLEDQILWRDSATVLLHDRSDRAALLEVLPRLIGDLKEAGYEFTCFDSTAGAVRF